jgi:hypothetical protein
MWHEAHLRETTLYARFGGPCRFKRWHQKHLTGIALAKTPVEWPRGKRSRRIIVAIVNGTAAADLTDLAKTLPYS